MSAVYLVRSHKIDASYFSFRIWLLKTQTNEIFLTWSSVYKNRGKIISVAMLKQLRHVGFIISKLN